MSLGTIHPGGATLSFPAGDGVEVRPIVELTARYAIAQVPARVAGGGRVIMCRKCKRVSCNSDDVAEKYCGNCHEYLDAIHTSKGAQQR